MNSQNTSSGTILVVDDKPENLSILMDTLTKAGYRVLIKKDGASALRLADLRVPDLILLDVLLPNLSGFEVCKRLKSNEKTRDIPVIFMTVLTKLGDKIKGFEAGGVDYITKPFQLEEVLARVGTHLTLRKLQRHLEDLVAQRTNELRERNIALENRNRELREAREAADIAHRAKHEFLASISHELRTPLNGVLGYAQLLEGAPDITEKQQRFAKNIVQSGNHLLMIINDLIAIAKIEAGKMKTDREPLDLVKMLGDLDEMFRLQSCQKGLDFACELAPDLPEKVLGDERRLRQILINLVGNGIKFTEKGRVQLHVRTLAPEEQEPNAHSLRFSIEDTGVGISPEDIDRIFAPFYQKGNKLLAETTGSGLGLTISQRLLGMMGSQLRLESTPGEGSRFWFDLTLTGVETR